MKTIIKIREQSFENKLSLENKLLAKILLARGFDTDEKAFAFLNPDKIELSDLSVFQDCEKVINRIKYAIDNSQNIVIYGDFDTDGVCSTAILYKTLKHLGAKVSYYIPDRALENHGLNKSAIIKLISKSKAKLIITVDNGISNIEEVKSRGAKVYVISTKELSKDGDAIVVDDYPYYLSSVAISPAAFYLAYYVALFKGYDVDKPRNLAKSVTVE